jgi:tRNA A37 methylthiotransferase MiaB
VAHQSANRRKAERYCAQVRSARGDTAAIDATAVATTIRHLISTGTSELVLLAAVARCHLNVTRAEFGDLRNEGIL